jgi:hypothetical protein
MATLLAQHLLTQRVRGMSCMAMFAASPSAAMGSSGAGSIVVTAAEGRLQIADGKAADIAMVITDILPQTVPLKTMMEVEVLTQVLKFRISKVQDHFVRQCLSVWGNSYGKVNEALRWN